MNSTTTLHPQGLVICKDAVFTAGTDEAQMESWGCRWAALAKPGLWFVSVYAYSFGRLTSDAVVNDFGDLIGVPA